jgi:hypothetical protein
MKITSLKAAIAVLLVWTSGAMAQNYSIDWYTIDSGGGTSTGGVYTVSGTIGQPDAGKLTGGNYTLEGGFWGIIAAVQTPGAPLLSVILTPTNTVVISWPSSSPGFTLEQNPALATPGWTVVPGTPPIVNGKFEVIVTTPAGNRFYRLKN